MKCREFSAWLQIDGQPVSEFALMRIGSSVECYIESLPQKNFSVHWSCDHSELFSSGYIFVDGKAYPGRFLQGASTTYRSGARTGPTSERPFTFMETQRNGKVLGEDAHPLGTVQLKIVLAERGEGRPNSYKKADPAHRPDQPSQRESGHRAGLGNDQPATQQFPLTWEGKPVTSVPGGSVHSYVKFIFKYRPREWLKQYGIHSMHNQYVGGSETVSVDPEVTGPVSTEEYQETLSKFMRYILENEGIEAARRMFPNMDFNISYGPKGVPPQVVPAPAPSLPPPQPHMQVPPQLQSQYQQFPMSQTVSPPQFVVPSMAGMPQSQPAPGYPQTMQYSSYPSMPPQQPTMVQQYQAMALQSHLNAQAMQIQMQKPSPQAPAPALAASSGSSKAKSSRQPEPIVVDSESESDREPTPQPQPKPKRKYRTKEQIAADKAAKEKEREEWRARVDKQFEENMAERERNGGKRPPAPDWDKMKENTLKGRTWEEVIGKPRCYKGYKFTKGSKPSKEYEANEAKRKAAEEAEAAASFKGKEKEEEREDTPCAPSSSTPTPRPQQSRSVSSSSVQQTEAQQLRASNAYTLPRTAAQAGPSRLANSLSSSSGVPMGGPQQIHGFMNMYAPAAPGVGGQRAPNVIPMVSREQAEQMMRRQG